MSREDALLLMRKFIVPEDLGTPPGAVTLRGATNFRTPAGWDTVYTPVFNSIERPAPPMLVVRVETDWYMHETEFRYVLQPGEGISGAADDADRPGVLRAAGRDHAAASARARNWRRCGGPTTSSAAARRPTQVTTPYGIPYSPWPWYYRLG